MKAKEYADGIRGLTHKKTASVDFEKGAQFVLESMKWRNAKKDPPPLDTRVLVKSSGKFVIIRISAFIIMAISFLILFYKNDSDNYMAILLQIIVWLMLIYAELCDIESLL